MSETRMQQYKLLCAKTFIKLFGTKSFYFFYNFYKLLKDGQENIASQQLHQTAIPEPLVTNAAGKIHINYGKRNDLLPFLRRNIALYPYGLDALLVSIIILNRNGVHYLRQLFPAIQANTIYPRYEIILVDNDSSDGSCTYAEDYGFSDLTIIRLKKNYSFSMANNIGARRAKGTYLVFLNNDTEVCYGWLTEAMLSFIKFPKAACIGTTLVYAELNSFEKGGEFVLPGLSVQHTGCAFRFEENFIRPINVGKYLHPIHINKTKRIVPAVSAACQIWKKNVFNEIGGFDEGYFYGYEDVDICLRARRLGFEIVHCPESFVIHNEFGTQKVVNSAEKQKNRLKNMAHFSKRWYATLYSEFWMEKIFGTPFLAESSLTVAITVTEYNPLTTCGDYFSAVGLGNALEKIGYRVVYLPRRPIDEWSMIPDDIDVLIVMMDDFPLDKKKLRKGVITVAWIRNWVDRWYERPWLKNYHIVLTSSDTSLRTISKKLHHDQYQGLLRIAADDSLFYKKSLNEKYKSDICFVGNIFHVPRDIVANLNLTRNWRFRYWGRLESPSHPFKPFHEGRVPHYIVPEIYNSANIVMEDCTSMCKPWGCINSRTFEAMACGACVVSNDVPELLDLFPEEILVYRNKQELDAILTYYLEHDEERKAIGEKARKAIISGHTYRKRAEQFRTHLSSYLGLNDSVFMTDLHCSDTFK